MEKLKLPICDLDLPGIKSERKLEEHITQLLQKEGWSVQRQVAKMGCNPILLTNENPFLKSLKF